MRFRYVELVFLVSILIVPAVASALNVRITAIGPDTIVIKWDKSNAGDFGYYQIWREELSKSDSKIVDTWADRERITYTDNDVQAGTEYNYTVKVFDDQDHFLDQGSVSAFPCLERNWMMFIGGILLIVFLAIILRFLLGLPYQVLVPIVVLIIGIAGALMWLSNIASNVPACP